MDKIFKALRLAFGALLNTKMLGLLLIPPVVAIGGLFVLFFVFWQGWTTDLGRFFGGLWIFQWAQSFPDLGYWLAVVFLLLLFVPLSYLLSVVLTSIFVMPLVLISLGRTTYADLEKKRGGTVAGSIWNTLKATIIFLVCFIVTLPLWLIPGGQILVPILLASWLNKRVFLYDVLQDYASREERLYLEKTRSHQLYGLGMILGLLAYVPLAFFLVPVVSALSYSYFGLEELRDLRHQRQSQSL